MKGIPFWEDLFAVTGAVPPWGMFKLLAEHPEIITRVPVPLTFLMVPGDKIEARICTGLDHKLHIRRSIHSDFITFETMAQNLKSCFESRGSDGQPFVCTVYGDDWRPHFVLSEVFNLFILYLRHSCGEMLSSSYGPEEQREANALFPRNVCMIQAYLPLESQTRYLAVTLRSPVKTLMEVYRAQHLGKGCFTNSKDTLDSIVVQHTRNDDDFYQPLSSSEPDAQIALQMSASIISNLRKQCNIKLPALVCEYVRDVQGDIYLVAVARCSRPQMGLMSMVLQPFRPSAGRLNRIMGKQPLVSSRLSSRRSTAASAVSMSSLLLHATSPKARPSPAPAATGKRVVPQLALNVEEEERKEGLETSKQTGGRTFKRGGRPESISINVFPDQQETEKKLSLTPDGLDIDDPHPVGKNLEQEPGPLKVHGHVLSDRHQALIEVPPLPHDHKNLCFLLLLLLLLLLSPLSSLLSPSPFLFLAPTLSQPIFCLQNEQRAQEYHDDGKYEDALRVLADAEKAALDAISEMQPQQAAAIRANPPNARVSVCVFSRHV